MLISVVHTFFLVYEIMLFARIIGSWFPQFYHHPIMRFIAHYTDPYLGLFRRIIPPIGGVLDISPFLAFIGLGLIESLVNRLIGGF